MASSNLTSRLALAYAAYELKDEPRAGWVLHGVTRPESVAAHSWGTAYLCLLFGQDAAVDVARAVAIAVVHDLAEAKTGDFIARATDADRQVAEEDKAELERQAIQELLPEGQGALRELWQAYEDRTDDAARFVRDMNLIDMCLEALRYERGARYDPERYVPSSGGHLHLDEFFLSAEQRLDSDLAKHLYAAIKGDYDAVRARPEPLGDA